MSQFARVYVAVLLVGLLSGFGCTMNDRQDEFDNLMAGVEADPSTYELVEFGCVKLEDRVSVTGTIRNTSSQDQAYSLRIAAVKVSGQTSSFENLLPWLSPGESHDISTWFGAPDEYSDEVECQVSVNVSPLALDLEAGED